MRIDNRLLWFLYNLHPPRVSDVSVEKAIRILIALLGEILLETLVVIQVDVAIVVNHHDTASAMMSHRIQKRLRYLVLEIFVALLFLFGCLELVDFERLCF